MATKKETEGKTEAKAKNTVTVHLPKAPRGQRNWQFVGVNGKTYKVMKGVDVEVPPEVAEVLRNSQRAREAAEEYLEAEAK